MCGDCVVSRDTAMPMGLRRGGPTAAADAAVGHTASKCEACQQHVLPLRRDGAVANAREVGGVDLARFQPLVVRSDIVPDGYWSSAVQLASIRTCVSNAP